MADEQSAVIEFLSDPRTHGGEAVERIDTHISAVFLAGDGVFKLKRAVRLPFLDFTGVEARRRACEAEYALNRRTAPELYRGVVAVTRGHDGRLALDGAGPAVDWLVAMNRFPQEALFDRLLTAGGLGRVDMVDLAEAIAAFHRDAERRPQHGGRAGIEWTIANNAASMAPFVPPVFEAAAVAALEQDSRAALDGVSELLERRRQQGFVRQCHGDLHLRNICRFGGRPLLFDAIEFSEAIACVDVLYDLAFLLMDLDQRGRRDFASYLFNHYQQVWGDLGALRALPLFLSLRAAIRAHVAAAMAAGEAGSARAKRTGEARGYLAAAREYLAPVPPRLLAIGGLSGSGKSLLARELAPDLGRAPGAVVVRTDVLRKRLMGVGLDIRLAGEGYSAEMTERTYKALYDEVAQALAAGQAVVADAVFARPEQRQAIAEVAQRAGVPFTGLWLESRPEVAAGRIFGRRRNVSDATVEVLHQQLTYDLGDIAWRRIESSGGKGETVAVARRALGI